MAVIFTMRVATCVSAVVLLFITTPQQVLFKSLRSVGVPKVYVLTLEMAYRYIFLLMDMVRESILPKKPGPLSLEACSRSRSGLVVAWAIR